MRGSWTPKTQLGDTDVSTAMASSAAVGITPRAYVPKKYDDVSMVALDMFLIGMGNNSFST